MRGYEYNILRPHYYLLRFTVHEHFYLPRFSSSMKIFDSNKINFVHQRGNVQKDSQIKIFFASASIS